MENKRTKNEENIENTSFCEVVFFYDVYCVFIKEESTFFIQEQGIVIPARVWSQTDRSRDSVLNIRCTVYISKP